MTKKPRKKAKNHYVDNEKLYQVIVEYKQKLYHAKANGLPLPKIPDYAGECIQKIANNMSKKYHKFARYSYNDEMESDAILSCINYFDNFDETKWNNPLAYFTQFCINSNIQRINTEKKNQYIKMKLFENEILLSSNMEFIDNEKNGLIEPEIYANVTEYTSDFERKEDEKRKIRKIKSNERKVMKDSLDRIMKDEKK